MHPLAQEAAEFESALKCGLATPDEVIDWAESKFAGTSEYDDTLADLSICNGNSAKAILPLLQRISTGADEFAALRNTLGRMHASLQSDPTKGQYFAKFLYSQATIHDYDLPSDLHFMVGAEDDYYLAAQGYLDGVDSATERLLDHLQPFNHERSEQDVDPNA